MVKSKKTLDAHFLVWLSFRTRLSLKNCAGRSMFCVCSCHKESVMCKEWILCVQLFYVGSICTKKEVSGVLFRFSTVKIWSSYMTSTPLSFRNWHIRQRCYFLSSYHRLQITCSSICNYHLKSTPCDGSFPCSVSICLLSTLRQYWIYICLTNSEYLFESLWRCFLSWPASFLGPKTRMKYTLSCSTSLKRRDLPKCHRLISSTWQRRSIYR